jgi:ubiquinone/menaquinone biosynthesis C-methylase UbiE
VTGRGERRWRARAWRALTRRSRPSGGIEGYFERLAPTYDDWWTRTGRLAGPENLLPGWHEEVEALRNELSSLTPALTLDVACGTGFLTRSLPGTVVGIDASRAMIDIARRAAPHVIFVYGDALALPFPDRSFGRLFASHIYGHFNRRDRARFLAEARRVAGELVIVEAVREREAPDGSSQLRELPDGSRWRVFKQWFTTTRLVDELRPTDVLHRGSYFIAVRSASAGW